MQSNNESVQIGRRYCSDNDVCLQQRGDRISASINDACDGMLLFLPLLKPNQFYSDICVKFAIMRDNFVYIAIYSTMPNSKLIN